MIWADTTPNHRQTPGRSTSTAIGDAGVVARTAYTTSHQMTWKSKVSGYLVTKAIAAGLMLIAALLVVLGHADEQAAVGVVPPMVAGVFTRDHRCAADRRPQAAGRFLLHPHQVEHRLVAGEGRLDPRRVRRGLRRLVDLLGLADAGDPLKIAGAPGRVLGAATAGYTAFLFGQCEGRDLWQTPLLLPILLAQAVVAGGAAFAVLDLFMDIPRSAPIWWRSSAASVASALLDASRAVVEGQPPRRARHASR